ncbi:MAG: CHASE domain-containing protein, partial [Syntrophales bacterium]
MSISSPTSKAESNATPTLLPAKHSALRNWRSDWIVLLVGLMITAAATIFMKLSVEMIAEREFTSQCKEIRNIITERLDDHARILQGSAALFNASEIVTRKQWHIFTQHQNIEKQLPGIQGIGFSLLIPREALSRHVQEIRREGFPEYKVRPDGDRDVYSSIVYLEPFFDRNLRAFGYDMFSEPVRRTTMERARDTNSAALSGKVTLVQETEKEVQAGTLMYVPVYRKGMPIENVEQRRAAIYGWVYSPYRMKDLMQGILSVHDLAKDKQIHLQVFDGGQPSPQSLLYESFSAGDKQPRLHERLVRQIPVDFNGQRWTLCFQQIESGYSTVAYIRVWLTMVGGIIITALLFALIRALLNTRATARRIADNLTEDLRHAYDDMEARVRERTADLAQANQLLQAEINERKRAEDALRESEERYSLTLDAVNDGLWDWNVPSGSAFFSPRYYSMLGYDDGEFPASYASWRLLVHAEDLDRVEEELRVSIENGKSFAIDLQMKLKSDGWRWVSTRGKVVEHDAAGKALRMVGILSDITGRKQAEEKIQAALREKETLLKEIHHRVKNNLQIISSLLNLQAKSIGDEKLEGIFRECQDRIAAMASVHQLLYKSQNFAEINFGNYLRDTASQLFRSYKTGKSTISLVVQAENIMLPIDTAIPCGLIINELVTNALKYAFPGVSKGEIKIEMSQTKQGIRLLFEDNGIGFPKDVDFSNSGTL